MISINVISLLTTGAVLAFMLGGLAVMFQAFSLAAKALLIGAGLSLVAGLGPRTLAFADTTDPRMLLIVVCAITGMLVLLQGRGKLALSLIWPAVWTWAVWPFTQPHRQSDWPLILLMVAPFALFILIWLLQRVLRPIYGEGVADHVAGTYLVRAIDTMGRSLGWLIAALFRIVRSVFVRR